MSIVPDRFDPSSDGPKREYLHEDADFQAEYGAIYEYLARCAVAGQVRATSRLVIYYEDNQCTLLLTDPFSAQILFHACDSVSEGLTALNERLANPPVKGWKKDKKARYR